MRFPKLTELDADQAQVYEGAPRDGTILVVGPPGTGKTVIAFHRAGYLKRLGQSPRVLMYNRVLRQYTGTRQDVAPGVEVSTVHSWTGKWWHGITNSWKAPTVTGDDWETDWAAVQQAALERLFHGKGGSAINWGHILIDEGQDHPEAMYAALNTIRCALGADATKSPAAITVLADDNQRLVPGKNSTVDQIRQALGLHASQKNVFSLKKNYRNTLQIARFAAHFYVGLDTGIPELPEQRKGSLPTICVSDKDTLGKNLNAFVDKISAYAKLHLQQEIGVLVPDNATRKSMYNRLVARVADSGIPVQTYASKDDTTAVDELKFDGEGRISVFNFKSAKGLEFDAVFVVDPGALARNNVAALHAKMTLYVMCSRARQYLSVMFIKDRAFDTFMGWMPPAAGNYRTEEL